MYSRCYQILQPEKEAKYSITTRQIRAAMENIIQKLAERFTFQFSLCGSHMEQEDFLKGVEMGTPSQEDGYQKIRESYNAVLRDNCCIGHNNFSRTVYLTISTVTDTPEDAFAVFDASGLWIKELFAALYGYVAKAMKLTERLQLLYGIYHPEIVMLEDYQRAMGEGQGD